MTDELKDLIDRLAHVSCLLGEEGYPMSSRYVDEAIQWLRTFEAKIDALEKPR